MLGKGQRGGLVQQTHPWQEMLLLGSCPPAPNIAEALSSWSLCLSSLSHQLLGFRFCFLLLYDIFISGLVSHSENPVPS